MSLEKSLDAYFDKFGEGFPVLLFDSDEEMLKVIKKAIETGKPYDGGEIMNDVPQKAII